MLFELTGYDFQVAYNRLNDLRVELDFAMELMIRFERKPGTELVSLVHGPQAELDREVDEYLADHHYELTHPLKKCPRCSYSVFRNEAPASCPEGCGELVDVLDLSADERYVREQSGFELAALGSFAPTRTAVCFWLVTEHAEHSAMGREDVKWTLDASLQALQTRMQAKVVTLVAIVRKANGGSFLGDRTDLLPCGLTLVEKYADYISVRHQLEKLLGRFEGLEKNHPSLIELGERPAPGFSGFPLPIAPPTCKPQETVSHNRDFTSLTWFGHPYNFARGNQAEAIRVLLEAHDAGGHPLHQKTIGDEIESAAGNKFELRTVFRQRKRGGKGYDMHRAWGTLIQPGTIKGTFRLTPPEKQS